MRLSATLRGMIRCIAALALCGWLGAGAAGAYVTPQPGTRSELLGITCLATTSCWAVGDYNNSAGGQLNQILRWNGRHWTRASTPEPGDTGSGDYNRVLGVTCTRPGDCWAV